MLDSGNESSLAQCARLRSSVVCFAAVAVTLALTNRCFSVHCFRFAALALHERPLTQLSVLLWKKKISIHRFLIFSFFFCCLFLIHHVYAGRRATRPRQKSVGSHISILHIFTLESDSSNGLSWLSCRHRRRRSRAVSPRQWQQCDIRGQVWCVCILDRFETSPCHPLTLDFTTWHFLFLTILCARRLIKLSHIRGEK